MVKRFLLSWSGFKDYLIITFGLALYTLGLTLFLIPAKIVTGGVAGIATLIYFASDFPIGISYPLMNAALILMAVRILGARFGIRTIYGIIVVSVLVGVFQNYFHQPIIRDEFMACIIGGIMGGIGIGLVFTQGGSSGGTDIIAMIITHYRNISPGRIFIVLDLIIIASSYLVVGSIEKIVYGYVTMAVSAYAVDLVIEGARQSLQVFVFSPKNKEIADRIGTETRRGITFLHGRGWYTESEVEVVMVIVRKQELQQIMRIVKAIDPESFISVASVMGVYGKGFEKIKF
ncbi:MAG: YitT family protein [Candidatus Delongbacteria bacterium]|nr:YitT family protein [Candidatus Delongbacteria bacterium]